MRKPPTSDKSGVVNAAPSRHHAFDDVQPRPGAVPRDGPSFDQPAGQPPDLAQSRRSVVQLLDADVDVLVRRRRLLLVHVSVDVDRAVRHVRQRHVGQQQRRVARRVQRHRRAVDLERTDLVDCVDVVIAEHEELPARGGGHPIVRALASILCIGLVSFVWGSNVILSLYVSS